MCHNSLLYSICELELQTITPSIKKLSTQECVHFILSDQTLFKKCIRGSIHVNLVELKNESCPKSEKCSAVSRYNYMKIDL